MANVSRILFIIPSQLQTPPFLRHAQLALSFTSILHYIFITQQLPVELSIIPRLSVCCQASRPSPPWRSHCSRHPPPPFKVFSCVSPHRQRFSSFPQHTASSPPFVCVTRICTTSSSGFHRPQGSHAPSHTGSSLHMPPKAEFSFALAVRACCLLSPLFPTPRTSLAAPIQSSFPPIAFTWLWSYNSLGLTCHTWSPLATSGSWAPQRWLFWTELCRKCKIHTEFQRLGMKREYKTVHQTFLCFLLLKWYFGHVGSNKIFNFAYFVLLFNMAIKIFYLNKWLAGHHCSGFFCWFILLTLL